MFKTVVLFSINLTFSKKKSENIKNVKNVQSVSFKA